MSLREAALGHGVQLQAPPSHTVCALAKQVNWASASCCRWELIESGAGAPYLLAALLPAGTTGPAVSC